jgi:hypothetical protein
MGHTLQCDQERIANLNYIYKFRERRLLLQCDIVRSNAFDENITFLCTCKKVQKRGLLEDSIYTCGKACYHVSSCL